jgi:hypothetical protein
MLKKSACLFAAPLLLIIAAVSNGQDLNGTWTGPFRSTGPAGTFDMVLARSAENVSGEVTVRFGGREAKGAVKDAKMESGKVTFSSDLAGGEIRFAAEPAGSRIKGTFEVHENKVRTLVGSFCVAKAGTPPCAEADIPAVPDTQIASQRADPAYKPTVTNPAYTSKNPRVLFDEAHDNFHRTTGNFGPFAALIRADGYTVVPNPDAFTNERLKDFDILVISNARGPANGSAFSDAEIEAVTTWIKNGGSLLLVADHTPFGGYAERLANRLGIDMSKGYTDDPANRDPVIKDLLFSRDNKLLGDHPITRGRTDSERINRVVSFTGQSLKSTEGTVILKLADTAYDEFPNSEEKKPAAGRAQAIALSYGKGKVFVSGEAAMLTAQLTPQGRKFGMNVDGIDNRQYALNVMHWLSGLLR